ncbi:hypothetical protein L345_05333, partial [Ophiophagus hannah]
WEQTADKQKPSQYGSTAPPDLLPAWPAGAKPRYSSPRPPRTSGSRLWRTGSHSCPSAANSGKLDAVSLMDGTVIHISVFQTLQLGQEGALEQISGKCSPQQTELNQRAGESLDSSLILYHWSRSTRMIKYNISYNVRIQTQGLRRSRETHGEATSMYLLHLNIPGWRRSFTLTRCNALPSVHLAGRYKKIRACPCNSGNVETTVHLHQTHHRRSRMVNGEERGNPGNPVLLQLLELTVVLKRISGYIVYLQNPKGGTMILLFPALKLFPSQSFQNLYKRLHQRKTLGTLYNKNLFEEIHVPERCNSNKPKQKHSIAMYFTTCKEGRNIEKQMRVVAVLTGKRGTEYLMCHWLIAGRRMKMARDVCRADTRAQGNILNPIIYFKKLY